MVDENELRDLFASAEAPNRLDAKTVVRRSRARRLPKQIAAGGVGALAVVGVTVLGLQALPFSQTAQDSALMPAESQQLESSHGAQPDDSTLRRLPADQINRCGSVPTDVALSPTGLVLEVAFPAAAAADSERIDGIVSLTNAGTEQVTGATRTVPAITVSQNGVVLWHTNADHGLVETTVALLPGEMVLYRASFEPVRCSEQDDADEVFPDNLPPLLPGDYEVSAAIDFDSDAPGPELELISGPATTITLE